MVSKQSAKYLAAVLIGLMSLGTGAQEAVDPAEPTEKPGAVIPIDEYDRGTPLRTAEGFLKAADESDYEKAAQYLDLRNLRGDARELSPEQLARRFDVITRRAEWKDVADFSDHPDGQVGDGLPSYRDAIGVVVADGEEFRLFMQKVPRGDGVDIWKISNASVVLIPQLYEVYGYNEIVENLRRKLPLHSFLGLELFKWVIVLAVSLLAYGTIVLTALIIRLFISESESPNHKRIFYFITRPFGIWVWFVAANSTATSLGRGITSEKIEQFSPISVVVTIWMLFVATGLLRDIYAAHLSSKGRAGAVVLLEPIVNGLKVFILIAAVLFYLDKIGINITTVLAGLGVGGVAVALALQKPMEDVFGAITLYTQQPVRVGDFCKVGDETGTIEEIGLRTTRLRTLANTLIAIPNSLLANEPIDNYSARQKILYRPVLRLRYDSSPQQLEQVMEGIRAVLANHERVLKENTRVRFKEIADDALLIEVYGYVSTTDWAEYLEFAEELNLQIMQVVADAGTSLTPPVKALQIEQGESG